MSELNNPWGILTGIRPAKIATKLLLEGKSDVEVVDCFVNEFKTTRAKAVMALQVAKCEMPVREAMYKDGVSIYIGIPFCPTRCLYCSFVTCGTKSAAKLIPDYIEALKEEIRFTGKLIAEKNKRIETIYIGGGTPTTLSAEQLDTMIGEIYNSMDLSACKEFTVEAGRPDTITYDKLKTLKKHKVDRISINPQSMNDETLKVIGRAHTTQQIKDAVAMARDCGFTNINMDMIVGLPGETFDMFKRTIEEVEALSPENSTVHTMSIKRSSRLHEYLEKYSLTSGEDVAKMVDYAAEFMSRQGKHPYYMYRQKNQLGNLENVGYAKMGYDNLYNIYIMEEIQTILALGCGGVTKTVEPVTDRIERVFNFKEPQDYLARFDEVLDRKRGIEF